MTMATPVPPIEGRRLGAQALEPAAIEHVSEAIRTTRAIRRFRPEPVDGALVQYVLHHATKAGSGSNRQPWRFVVVDDLEVKRRLGDWYREGWEHLVENGYTSKSIANPTPVQIRTTEAAERFAIHFEDAPVVIVPCFLPHPFNPADVFAGASIFTAVQNLLLAARSIGLGGVVTTMQAITFPGTDGVPTTKPDYDRRLRQVLDLPDDVVPMAVIPLGWPDERFSEGKRKPVDVVTYRNAWGAPWEVSGA
jgi:nitroreductase